MKKNDSSAEEQSLGITGTSLEQISKIHKYELELQTRDFEVQKVKETADLVK